MKHPIIIIFGTQISRNFNFATSSSRVESGQNQQPVMDLGAKAHGFFISLFFVKLFAVNKIVVNIIEELKNSPWN